MPFAFCFPPEKSIRRRGPSASALLELHESGVSTEDSTTDFMDDWWFQTWVCLKMLCKPLKPMVFMIIIPFLNGYFIGNINPTFSDNPKWFLFSQRLSP